MIRILLAITLFCSLAFSAKAQYLETFSTPNKGYLTGMTDDFTGVDWTLSPWSTGDRDANDYFQTTVAGKLESVDLDAEVCWTSPLLTVSATGNIAFTADLEWIGFDNDQTNPLEFINVEYQINGGAWVRHPNVIGGDGDPAYTVRYTNLMGNNDGAVTTNFPSIAVVMGNSFRVRICVSDNSNNEFVTIDNVSVTGVTTGCAQPTVVTAITPTGSCNPNTGAIKVTASAATPGYNVAWSGPSSGNPAGVEIASSGGMYTITPLTAGAYTITVTDAANCSATTNATVGTAAALSLVKLIIHETCTGASDGEIDLQVSNGVPPYTYSWSNLPGSPDPQDQIGLSVGTYTVTVTDAAGCTATTSTTINLASPFGSYFDDFNISNKGILDGSTCSGANGTSCTNNDFVGVNWSIYGLSTLTGIEPDDYFKSVGGRIEAKDVDQVVCWESPLLNTSPPGTNIGFRVSVAWENFDEEPPGPNPPDGVADHIDVEYRLDGGSWVRLSNRYGGGLTGHTIVYANGGGNNQSGIIGVIQPNTLTGNTLQIRVCGLNNSKQEWFRIDSIQASGVNGLACPCPTITFTATPTNTCSGTNNGQIAVSSVSGGTGPYMYSKDNGANYQSGATFTGLAAGMYNVVVKDANGCVSAATQVTVGTFMAPACAVTGPDFVCNNTENIVYSATGGMSAYSWGISGGGTIPGSTTGSSVSVTSGSYLGDYTVTVTVTDANGCTSSCSKQSFTYYAKPPADITVSPNPVCLGVTLDLSITAAASSTVSWTGEGITNPSGNPSTTALPTTAGPHIYGVTVTSDNGCSNTGTANVTVYDAIMASASPTDALCNGGNGNITMTMSGGNGGPYNVAWTGPVNGSSPNQTTGYVIMNLPAGNYSITVTDGSGCTKSTSAMVSQPATSITGSATPTSACNVNDGTIQVTASGGTPGYQVKWGGTSSGDPAGVEIASSGGMYTITALTVGTYTITVTDANGCAFSTTQMVTTAGCCMVSANAGSNRSICPGGSSNIGGTPTGSGTPTLSYAWAPAGTLSSATAANPTATPAGTTTYTVTVTSTAGCTSTASVTVSVYTAITASGTPTDALCNGGNGSVTVFMSGGNGGPYNVAWNGPVNGSSPNKTTGYVIVNLPAGAYGITVTDGNGCTKTTSATVGQPAVLTASGTPTDVSCTGDANGKITMTIGGGTSPYDITWNGPGVNDGTTFNQNSGYMITNLPAGTYFITVTDDHGCTKETDFVLVGTANPLPTCSISDAMTTVCPNSMGNQYSAPAAMDQYAWSIMGNGSIPGSTSGQSVAVTAGASGTYTVTVTITKNGCSSTCSKTVSITQIPFMIVSTAQYCQDDPGPVIGLNGSEVGAMYQLQTSGNVNIGAPVAGTGTAITFGSHPNGNYKVVITGGTCNGTLQKSVSGTATECTVAIPNFCACNAPNNRAEVSIKVTAPAFQMWTVVDVIGLYGPNNPYPPITVGTPLTYVGMGMYTLEATRDNVKGYYVKVSNGFTMQEIQVGNPAW